MSRCIYGRQTVSHDPSRKIGHTRSLSLSSLQCLHSLFHEQAALIDATSTRRQIRIRPSLLLPSFLPQSLFGFSGMRRRQHLLWTVSAATAMDGRMDGRVAAVLEILPFNELLIVSGTPLAGVT